MDCFLHSLLYFAEKERIDDDCCHSTKRKGERKREERNQKEKKSSTKEKTKKEHHLEINILSLSHLTIKQDYDPICIQILVN